MSLRSRIEAALLANRNAEGIGQIVDTNEAIHGLLVEIDGLEASIGRARDCSYLDGLKQGWNLGVHEDQERFDEIYNSIRGQIKLHDLKKRDEKNGN